MILLTNVYIDMDGEDLLLSLYKRACLCLMDIGVAAIEFRHISLRVFV